MGLQGGCEEGPGGRGPRGGCRGRLEGGGARAGDGVRVKAEGPRAAEGRGAQEVVWSGGGVAAARLVSVGWALRAGKNGKVGSPLHPPRLPRRWQEQLEGEHSGPGSGREWGGGAGRERVWWLESTWRVWGGWEHRLGRRPGVSFGARRGKIVGARVEV